MTYWLSTQPASPCCPPASQLPPLLLPFDSVRSRGTNWSAATVPAFHYDSTTHAATVTLPPGAALRAAWTGTYAGREADLPIDSLRVTTLGGRVLYAGNAAAGFRPVTDQLYLLPLVEVEAAAVAAGEVAR